ncbi:MAG TPA: hypothetical protein VK790_14940 [Solirubrobacteraceae bacterium]|jgi:hypothetical protein|nr:hypothetical protein [Solirubrobacteraceae bacterium]
MYGGRDEGNVAQRQLNIRVDAAMFDVLEAAAFIDGMSLPELIRPILDDLAKDLAADPAVQLALRAREERSATRSGKLTRLPARQAEDV